jgi:hypothetical protein
VTPRERMRVALSHKEPDRVPIDLGASIVTSITKAAYVPRGAAAAARPWACAMAAKIGTIYCRGEGAQCRDGREAWGTR